ncbi:hypothetical protein [Nitrosophilus kaiyonis]|uniref:hypothetical protein n=1 Tax=Nitrosophilus kaiyonis TaxID=2930200 RepID=UPI00249232AB|nr:hypothetical protein [Nitrosophilus kaiyonis]
MNVQKNIKLINKPKTISGIDTLYYFLETNKRYDDLYLNILDQIETTKDNFENNYIKIKNKDIIIALKDLTLEFLGNAEGFIWLQDTNRFFKIGFKDPYTNKNLHNIRVQLLTDGIYTIGIKSLLTLIDNILQDFINGYKTVTRADLNIFIQYDMSFVNKDMFVTRKQKSTLIYKELYNSKRLETIYIGKKPFMLRIYDKKIEMLNSNKSILMQEFFLNNAFSLEESIFNIEFEMHRQYLKNYNIDTIEDLLKNAESLFKKAMDEIRLVLPETIKEKNRYRAKTDPLWLHIKNSYEIKEFMQIQTPLERIKSKSYLFNEEMFIHEHIRLARKANAHNILITKELYEELFEIVEKSLKTNCYSKEHFYTPITLHKQNGETENLRWLPNGEIIKPLKLRSVKRLSNYELLQEYQKITKELNENSNKNDFIKTRYQLLYKEIVKRNLEAEINI